MTIAAFDSQEVNFVATHDDGCRHLTTDDMTALGFISSASNGTMLVRLGEETSGRFGIYKPGRHERPLWDFPGELFRREVAAYEVSQFLGWNLVPPTIERDGPRGPGSVQLFVPHDPAEHYFELLGDPRWTIPLVRMAMFDMLTNNADRKGGHVLHQTGHDRLYGIDHGLTFHGEPKLRTVIWDFPAVAFAEADKSDLRRLRKALVAGDDIAARLNELLTAEEVRRLAARAGQVAVMTAMPDLDPDERWYPWPPV